MPHRTFSTQEAADYLHLSAAEVGKLVLQNTIPFERTGKRTVFRKIDLDAWASKRIFDLSDKHLDAYHQATSAKTDKLKDSRGLIISELMNENAIRVDLASRTKPSLLRDMVTLAEQTGHVFNPDDLLESLKLRESLCSTAMPEGLALLHPRHQEPYMFADSFIAVGKTLHPIPFGASDGKETDIFFLICCQIDRLHLHVLARLCLMCRQKCFLERLRNVSRAADILDLIRTKEKEIIRQTVETRRS